VWYNITEYNYRDLKNISIIIGIMKPTLLVLAAGMGSRYGKLKQLDPVGPSGEVILDYSVYDAISAGFGKVVFVIRKEIEKEFTDAIGQKFKDAIQVEYVFQELANLPAGFEVQEGRAKPWGTSHAVMMARDIIKEPFAIINADDFYGTEAFQIMANHLSSLEVCDSNNYFMVGYPLNKTLSDFGSVSRGISEVDENGFLNNITERTHIEKTPSGARYKDGEDFTELTGNEITSMNFFGFGPSYFDYSEDMFKTFLTENKENLKAEFYVPFVVNKLVGDNRVKLKVLSSDAEWFGITYLEDKPFVDQKIRDLIARGVYPNDLWGKS
jgi:UTP-glucose-1-phosphate uridylyltransferase